MALKDLTETGFDPDLHLPIRGKKYRVPAPDYEAHKEMQETIVATGLPPVEQSQQAIDASAARSARWSTTACPGR